MRSLHQSIVTDHVLRVRCRVTLVFVFGEIQRQLGWIGWIGTESQTANWTGVFTRPDASAFPIGHHCFQADLFCIHLGSLHRFPQFRRRKGFTTRERGAPNSPAARSVILCLMPETEKNHP